MDNQSPPPVEPVILTDEVIDLARGWAQMWLERQPQFKGPEKELVTQCSFRFPADGPEHHVALYLEPLKYRARAYTALPNQQTAEGNPLGPRDHFLIGLEPRAAFSPRELLAALLHEVTHVVDPEFVTDARMTREWMPEARRNALLLYGLRSERRAFASMWVAEVENYIRWRESMGDPELDPSGFVDEMRDLVVEFRYFMSHADIYRPEIVRQIRTIAEAVRARV